MPKLSANIMANLRGVGRGGAGAAPAAGGFTSLMFSMPTAAYLGVGLAKKAGRTLKDGTSITNPLFFKNTHEGYGKRGLDANNHGTDGLVQSLHGRRRMR
jgi:hypothetical protein